MMATEGTPPVAPQRIKALTMPCWDGQGQGGVVVFLAGVTPR